MILFLTSSIIIMAMMFEKLFFFRLENLYSVSFIGWAEMFIYIVTFLVGVFYYFRQTRVKKLFEGNFLKSKFFNKFNILVLFFAATLLFFVSLSFYLNYVKLSIHWDAVALYDARAKFLENGMLFSNMPSLAQFDNLNKYYYLLYPPYTSIAHFVWRASNLTTNIPVSVYYSVVLVVLLTQILTVGKERFGLLIGVVLAFLVSSNTSMFNVAIKEYTNLPFDLYIVGGTLLLYSYLRNKETWKYVFGVLMVSSSLWVRLLEPIWLAITLAFLFSLIEKNKIKKSLLLVLFLLFFCLIEYYSWNYFTNSIAHNPGFLNFTKINMIDTFIGFFTGAPLVVATNIAKSWGIPFFVHMTALAGLVMRPKYVLNNKPLLFLGCVILTSMLVYFAEFYVISFQVDWWSTVTMSIDRSSTFLIPISAFVLFELLLSSNLFKKIN